MPLKQFLVGTTERHRPEHCVVPTKKTLSRISEKVFEKQLAITPWISGTPWLRVNALPERHCKTTPSTKKTRPGNTPDRVRYINSEMLRLAGNVSVTRIDLCTRNRERCIVRIRRRFLSQIRAVQTAVRAKVDQTLRAFEEQRVPLLVKSRTARRFLVREHCVRRKTVRRAHRIQVCSRGRKVSCLDVSLRAEENNFLITQNSDRLRLVRERRNSLPERDAARNSEAGDRRCPVHDLHSTRVTRLNTVLHERAECDLVVRPPVGRRFSSTRP